MRITFIQLLSKFQDGMRRIPVALVLSTLILSIPIAVWSLDGFNIGPYQKEDIALLVAHGVDGTAFDEVPSRIFRDIPIWLGMHITPHSFQGWQIMLFLLTALRGFLFYQIARRIVPGLPYFAIACGFLACFNSADSGYFLLNTTGAQFSLVLCLASCVFALMHLERPTHGTLAAMWGFQLLSGFTYPGYFLWMLAIPTGAWAIKRLSGGAVLPWFLVKSWVILVVAACCEMLVIKYGNGWDAHVADLNAVDALSGYAWAILQTIDSLVGLVTRSTGTYLTLSAVIGIVTAATLLLVMRDDTGPSSQRGWKVIALTFSGLILLGLISYLPYSITIERFADRRQLFGLGLFGFGAFLFILFLALQRAPRSLQTLAIGLVAASTILAGLEKRTEPVQRYRSVEALLSAVAVTVPKPPSNVLLLVELTEPCGWKGVHSIYRHSSRFSMLLSFMYQDPTLQGQIVETAGDPLGTDCPTASADDDDTADQLAQPKRGKHRRGRLGWKPEERSGHLMILPLYYSVAEGAGILDESEWELQARRGFIDGNALYASMPRSPNLVHTLSCAMFEPALKPAPCK